MKKSKILLVIIIAIAVLVPIVVMALTPPPPSLENGTPFYKRFEGSVASIGERHPHSNTIRVQGEEEHHVIDFIITENTLFMTVDGSKPVEEINVGDKLAVYFIEPMVSATIFPPQREASVFVRLPGTDSPRSIFFGRFDENLVSDDNFLRLNISDDTVILRANGEDGRDVRLAGRDLAVVYTIATRSIPAQTTPELIVILNPTPEMAKELFTDHLEDSGENGYIDFEVGGPLQLDQETIDQLSVQLAESLKDAPIIVRGETITAPEAVVRNNLVFLPLRAIAEALDYDVLWEAETSSIALGAGIRLQIGSYEYFIGRMAPITLHNAPIIVNGLTYVPMEFFSEVLGYDAGFMIEDGRGEIMISDREERT